MFQPFYRALGTNVHGSGLGLPIVQEIAAQHRAEVSVDGYKAPDYGCLSQQMGSETNATKAAQKNREAQNVTVEKQLPNKVGLATPAATSVRMGNTFGTSVKPQRP